MQLEEMSLKRYITLQNAIYSPSYQSLFRPRCPCGVLPLCRCEYFTLSGARLLARPGHTGILSLGPRHTEEESWLDNTAQTARTAQSKHRCNTGRTTCSISRTLQPTLINGATEWSYQADHANGRSQRRWWLFPKLLSRLTQRTSPEWDAGPATPVRAPPPAAPSTCSLRWEGTVTTCKRK